MEQKKLISAILISVVFLLVWYSVVVPRFAPPPPTSPTTNTAVSGTSTEVAPVSNLSSASTSISAGEKTSAEAGKITDHFLRDTRNDIAITPMGGAIRHWTIKSKLQD